MSRTHTDLSTVQISAAPSPDTSGTSLGVSDANAALLPDIYPWWGLLRPHNTKPTRSNSEIVKVTAGLSSGGTTTYTIVRSQGIPVTTAQSPEIGWDLSEVHTAQKQIDVDDNLMIAVLPINHTVSGLKVVLNANENQAFGDVCFINSDGQAQLGDADAIATSSCIVMCADASISANADGNYLLLGFARNDSWAWTVGGLIYLTVTGTSGNTLSQTAPTGTDDVVQIMGVATHEDRMYFNPQLVQIERT